MTVDTPPVFSTQTQKMSRSSTFSNNETSTTPSHNYTAAPNKDDYDSDGGSYYAPP